jgi:hypothetical protein
VIVSEDALSRLSYVEEQPRFARKKKAEEAKLVDNDVACDE